VLTARQTIYLLALLASTGHQTLWHKKTWRSHAAKPFTASQHWKRLHILLHGSRSAPNQSMKPTAPPRMRSVCLPQHPAVAYLCLVRRHVAFAPKSNHKHKTKHTNENNDL